MKRQETLEENKKLYSQRSIGIATYLGGPLAAGILVRQNFINLNKERQGLNSLLIGIVSTFILFAGIFSIPDDIIDKIPNSLIPLIYAGVIYLIVESIQGADLKEFKENSGTFYSGWNAAGIGLLSGILIAGGILGYIFLLEEDWDVDSYNSKIELHTANEEQALKLFEMLDSAQKNQITQFIKSTGIPKWEENLTVLNSIDKIENVPEEFISQVNLLKEYTRLRIEAYELISKAVQAESSEYDEEIIKRHNRIDEIISQL
jgi:hypothetical protein